MSIERKPDKNTMHVRVVGNSESSQQEITQFLLSISGVNVVVEPSLSGSSSPVTHPVEESIIIDEFGPDRDQELANLRRIKSNHQRSQVVAILKDRSVDLMRKVLQAGADDILFWPLDLAPTMRLLLEVAAKQDRLQSVTGGEVCAVTSSIGGVGVTSAVANLALAMRYTFQKRVALIDLDFRSSGLSSYLSLEPSKNISWLTSHGREINSIELGNALTPHRSGIQLLAAADLNDAGEPVSESALSEILNVMRQLFDYVIVDCGDMVDTRIVDVWRHSDHLLYLLEQSVNGIRCAWRFGQLFEQTKFAAAKPRFVINRFDPRHPASDEHIAFALKDEIFARIPGDARAMQRREARGLDLWHASAGSPLITAYEELADAVISGRATANNTAPTVIPRLLAALGARQTEEVSQIS